MAIPSQIGAYTLKQQIGQGNTAVIYRASAGANQPDVVLKTPRRDGTPDEHDESVRQIRWEGFTLPELTGEGIPKYYDYFETGEYCCLIEEYIDGHDLNTVLAKMTAPLPQADAVQWGLRICNVLLKLKHHHPSLIYRFIAPDNLMLDRSEQLYIIDYGKTAPAGSAYGRLGVIGYSAPEQYGGQADTRSDIYSTAVLLYHATTCRDPRGGNAPFDFHAHPPRALNPALSEAYERLLLKALQMKAENRHQSVEDFEAALLACR
jgi:eukaryotic-like serine/threonine-protein kinase